MEEQNNLLPEQYSGIDLNIEGYKLTQRQREIALLLAVKSSSGQTVQDIANKFGISREMVYKEKRAEGFKEFQNEIISTIYGNLFNETVIGMHEMLADKNTPKALKVKLFQTVLNAHGKLGGQGVTINDDQTKKITLQDLEQEVIDMENDLLGD